MHKLMIKQASILIPTLNEQTHIEACISSLIEGTCDTIELELLIIDGGSSDKTTEIVQNLTKTHTNIRLLNNPGKIVPCAMNIGLEAAKFEYLIWCGSHAIYHPGYVENSLRVHQEIDCASSGGVLTPLGKTPIGKAIAVATTSKFGIGSAPYRHSKQRTSAKTVFGGCFTKESVIKAGKFNENWVRNQDVEFNYRLIEKVGKIIIDPDIRCHYFCRESLTGLAKQYYQYGYWRLKTTLKHPNSFGVRLLAPVALTGAMAMSIVGSLLGYTQALLLPTMYMAICMLQAILLSHKQNDLKLTYTLALIFPLIHCSWGGGFIVSLLQTGLRKIKTFNSDN